MTFNLKQTGKIFYYRHRKLQLGAGIFLVLFTVWKLNDAILNWYGNKAAFDWLAEVPLVLFPLCLAVFYFLSAFTCYIWIGTNGVLVREGFGKIEIEWENVKRAGPLVVDNEDVYGLVLHQPVMKPTKIQKILFVPNYFYERVLPLSKLTGKQREADLEKAVGTYFRQ
jgi:hypothetical protein